MNESSSGPPVRQLGILTTLGCSPICYAQARILGRSLAKRFPDVPRAVVGAPANIAGLENCGWLVIPSSDPDLRRGFQSKLYLWKYSPFEATLFIDVDILPLSGGESLNEIIRELIVSEQPVAYYGFRRGTENEGGYQGTAFKDLRDHGFSGMWASYGGGHYFWMKGTFSKERFDEAAILAENSHGWIKSWSTEATGGSSTPDEVVIGLLVEKNLGSLPCISVFMAPSLWRKREHVNAPERVSFLHFYGNEQPLYYVWQALKLGAKPSDCIKFLLARVIHLRLRMKRILGRCRFSRNALFQPNDAG